MNTLEEFEIYKANNSRRQPYIENTDNIITQRPDTVKSICGRITVMIVVMCNIFVVNYLSRNYNNLL